MADIVSELASKSGVSTDLAKKGLGALLSFVKKSLPADSFSKVLSTFPGADNMMAAAAETGQEPAGGILSTVSGLAGKLFGGAGGRHGAACRSSRRWAFRPTSSSNSSRRHSTFSRASFRATS